MGKNHAMERVEESLHRCIILVEDTHSVHWGRSSWHERSCREKSSACIFHFVNAAQLTDFRYLLGIRLGWPDPFARLVGLKRYLHS